MPVRETPSTFASFLTQHDWRYQSWVRTPNWPHVPKRDLPINPYYDIQDAIKTPIYGGQISERLSDGYLTWFDLPKVRWTGATIRGLFDNAYASSGYAEKAEQIFYENVLKVLGRIADQKTNLPVAVAEGGKTVTLITSTATRVWESYRAFVRGNFKEVARLLGISKSARYGSWLEYKYGWMPLLMDIKGTAELFAEHGLGGRPLSFMVQSTSKGPITWALATSYVPFGGDGSVLAQWGQTFTSTYTCRVAIWIEVVNPNLTAAQQMGLTNPGAFAWEVIPFSFVIDWFISVGDWLKALTAMNGLTAVKAFRSNSNDMVLQIVQPETSLVRNSDTRYTMYESSIWMQRREYSRSPFVLTVPSPPEFRKPLDISLDRLYTAAALMKLGNRGSPPRNRLRL